jgi:hypothetical protein
VISHALWTKRFHQSLTVLGQTLMLNDKPFKVVGILPPGFHTGFSTHRTK